MYALPFLVKSFGSFGSFGNNAEYIVYTYRHGYESLLVSNDHFIT